MLGGGGYHETRVGTGTDDSIVLLLHGAKAFIGLLKHLDDTVHAMLEVSQPQVYWYTSLLLVKLIHDVVVVVSDSLLSSRLRDPIYSI